jgi:hypothetical protein
MSTSQPRPTIYNNKYRGTTHDQPQAIGGGTFTGYKSGEHSVGKFLPYSNSLPALLTIIYITASHFGHILLKAADGTMTKDQGG